MRLCDNHASPNSFSDINEGKIQSRMHSLDLMKPNLVLLCQREYRKITKNHFFISAPTRNNHFSYENQRIHNRLNPFIPQISSNVDNKLLCTYTYVKKRGQRVVPSHKDHMADFSDSVK